MELPVQSLKVKDSNLPGAGKGLFTKKFIPKGTLITEHLGKISTWNEADHDDGNNAYIYYVSKNHVIDAKDHSGSLAHFTNDARGYKKLIGFTNNSKYVERGKRVFIEATKDIQPNEEIFVSYGKEYWDVIRKNKIM
ncbi:MAG: SET domain-containing protein-lysine N-methyltransferase [Chitinophagaceae bacterium]|nr:SET domain-containing protein-lysine N-methyltransferase [Chitinophagaceae bacterium]